MGARQNTEHSHQKLPNVMSTTQPHAGGVACQLLHVQVVVVVQVPSVLRQNCHRNWHKNADRKQEFLYWCRGSRIVTVSTRCNAYHHSFGTTQAVQARTSRTYDVTHRRSTNIDPEQTKRHVATADVAISSASPLQPPGEMT